MSRWTRFMDMHSGGGTKNAPYEFIYIEAPEEEAKRVFYSRFGSNPERVSCTCCGDDYSINESDSLAQSSAFDRGCRWSKKDERYVEEPSENRLSFTKFCTVNDYVARDDVLVIRASEIKDHERAASVPEQGYVWQD